MVDYSEVTYLCPNHSCVILLRFLQRRKQVHRWARVSHDTKLPLLFSQSLLPTPCYMERLLSEVQVVPTLCAFHSQAPVPRLRLLGCDSGWMSESLRGKKFYSLARWYEHTHPLTFFVLEWWQYAVTQNYHTQRDYFVFFLKMKRQCVSKWAENVSGRDDLRAHQCRVKAEWMCKNGRAQQFLGRKESQVEAKQQSPSKPLDGKTWSNHQFPSLPDLKPSTFIGGWRRRIKTFSKEPSYAGSGAGELSVSNTREPLHAKQLG